MIGGGKSQPHLFDPPEAASSADDAGMIGGGKSQPHLFDPPEVERVDKSGHPFGYQMRATPIRFRNAISDPPRYDVELGEGDRRCLGKSLSTFL